MDMLVRDTTAEALAEENAMLRAELEQLRAHTSRLQLVTDLLPAAVAYVGADERYEYVNHTYREWFGQAPAEVLGRTTRDILGAEIYEHRRPMIERVLRGESLAFEVKFSWADGVSHDLAASYVPHFRDGQVQGFVILMQDVSERNRHLRTLEEAQRQLDACLQAAKAGIWEGDLVTKAFHTDVNLRRLLGLENIAPTEDVRALWRRAIHPEDYAMFESTLERCLRTGEHFTMEYRIVKPDGSIRWVGGRGQPQCDAEGNVIRVSGILVDVTREKEAEMALRDLNNELEARVVARTAELQEANASLLAFSYHVSHDLRGPLRAIVSTSTILQEDHAAELSSEARELLRRQACSASRLGQLIDDLLKFARLSREEIGKAEVDLSALACEAAEEALVAHPGTSTKVEIEAGLQTQADPKLLKLALLNLIENAVKYSPAGGTVRVGSRERGTFFVSDEGIGIEARYLEKIFEAFERLHRHDEFSGTGIGLANVRQVVERHGGRAWAESSPGVGSTFWISLP